MAKRKGKGHRKQKKSQIPYHSFNQGIANMTIKDAVLPPLDNPRDEMVRHGFFIPPSTAFEFDPPPLELVGDSLIYMYEPDPVERKIVESHLAASIRPAGASFVAEPTNPMIDWVLGKDLPIMDAHIPKVTPRFPMVMSGKFHTDEENLDMSYSLGLLGKHLGEAVTLPNTPTVQATGEEIIADLRELVARHPVHGGLK